MLFLKGSTPTVEGASSQLEARLRVKYKLTEHTGIDGYLAKGIEKPVLTTGWDSRFLTNSRLRSQKRSKEKRTCGKELQRQHPF